MGSTPHPWELREFSNSEIDNYIGRMDKSSLILADSVGHDKPIYLNLETPGGLASNME
jgi:hypothetical protein